MAPADDGLVAPLPSIGARPVAARSLARALGALAVVWLVLAGQAAPAQARVEKVPISGGPEEVTVGLQPREGAFYWQAGTKWTGVTDIAASTNPAVANFGNAEGNEVVHVPSVATYAIYWDPSDYYHGDWQGLIDGFLANLGSSDGQVNSVFAVDGQYTDTTNKPASTHSSFHGAYTDTHPYPETGNCTDPHMFKFGVPLLENNSEVCLTDVQVKAELERFIKQRDEEHHTLPKGMGTIYYLMTPPGVTVCLDEGGPGGHCSEFAGTQTEISEYEESNDRYPEEHAKWKKTKEEKTKKGEPDSEPEPQPPTAPTSLADYEKSFCSYHGVIGSGSTAILYGMIPWTAGGDGDGHLSGEDQTSGYACQDGGFEPGKHSGGEVEEKEREQEESLQEKEELEKKGSQEKGNTRKQRKTDSPNLTSRSPTSLPAWGRTEATITASRI